MESQENQYRWPKAEAVYPDRPGRSYALKRLRYRLRSFLHQGSIVHFEQFINQHPFLVTLLNEHADYSYPLVYRFLDKRFNSKQRFQAICDNLLFLPEKLTALSASSHFAAVKSLALPDVKLEQADDVQPHLSSQYLMPRSDHPELDDNIERKTLSFRHLGLTLAYFVCFQTHHPHQFQWPHPLIDGQ